MGSLRNLFAFKQSSFKNKEKKSPKEKRESQREEDGQSSTSEDIKPAEKTFARQPGSSRKKIVIRQPTKRSSFPVNAPRSSMSDSSGIRRKPRRSSSRTLPNEIPTCMDPLEVLEYELLQRYATPRRSTPNRSASEPVRSTETEEAKKARRAERRRSRSMKNQEEAPAGLEDPFTVSAPSKPASIESGDLHTRHSSVPTATLMATLPKAA